MSDRSPANGRGLLGAWRRLRAGTRIALLVLLAFVPLIAIHILSIIQIDQAQREHVEHDVGDLAHVASQAVAGSIDAARSSAQALADTASFKAQDPAAASATLQELLSQQPELANAWASSVDGRIYAAAPALPPGAPASIAGAPYFQQALATGQPVVQTVRGVPQRPDLFTPVVAVPAQQAGTPNGTVQISFQVIGLEELATHIALPPGSIVTIYDGQGTIIARSVDPQRWVGVSIRNTPLWASIVKAPQGIEEKPGLDGVDRLLGIQTVPGTDWRAVVGVPVSVALTPVTSTLYREFALFGLTLVVAGLLAWRGQALARRIEAERRRLQGVIDQLPEGVLLLAPDGRVLEANRALGDLLGIRVRPGAGDRESLEGAEWRQDGQPITWEDLPFERARRGGAVRGVQLAVRRPDGGRRDLLVSALPLGAGGPDEELLAVFVDVTPFRDLDRAKDEFISIAAHELRNPLAGLKGYADILVRLARRKGFDQEATRFVEAIRQQADRLVELTNRLLDVSRLQLGRLQVVRRPTDLVALAREVQESQQLLTDRHTITVEASVPELEGDVDGGQIREVLSNLVGNAIKYAPGGRIAIRVSRRDDEACVSVTDQGPGIPPGQLPHLFERFRQAGRTPAERAGGLGLGLYLSRGIVEAHGGQIGVESRPGQGSTFWFTLPLFPQPERTTAQAAASATR